MQHGLAFYETHDGDVATNGNVEGVLPSVFITEVHDITDLESGKRHLIWKQGMNISEAHFVDRGRR